MEPIKKYEILNNELTEENEILMTNLQNLKNKCEQLKNENNNLRTENEEYKSENLYLKNEYKKEKEELDKILYSRSYKIIKKINGIIKR